MLVKGKDTSQVTWQVGELRNELHHQGWEGNGGDRWLSGGAAADQMVTDMTVHSSRGAEEVTRTLRKVP